MDFSKHFKNTFSCSLTVDIVLTKVLTCVCANYLLFIKGFDFPELFLIHMNIA